MKHAVLDQVTEPGSFGFGQAGMGSPGEHRKKCRPVAGLGRDRQVISFEQSRHEYGCLGNGRSHRRDDDAFDIGVAFDDAGGAGVRQYVDFRIGPGPPQAADQRCRQQRVANAPQRDHQNA